MLGFRPDGIIRIHLCVSQMPLLVNNESGRHRQGPGLITIMPGHIDAELEIQLFQLI
jgi:hypothetical protein